VKGGINEREVTIPDGKVVAQNFLLGSLVIGIITSTTSRIDMSNGEG
jgi:hypothetical protein